MPRRRRSDLDGELLLKGATVRYAELRAELAALAKRFPSLQTAREAWRAVRGVRKSVKRRKRRKMSAEARARISAAQRARWAKQKKAAK
jgi:hypothetical protein